MFRGHTQPMAPSHEPATGLTPAAPRPQDPTRLGAEGYIEGVFLSPRVVDRGAFEEYAATLHDLFEKTATQAQTLKAASAEAQGLARILADAAQKFQVRLDAAARVLAGLDQRVTTAGALADGNAAREAADRALHERLAQIESKLAEAERQPKAARPRSPATPIPDAEALAAVCARVEAARESARAATERFEEVQRAAEAARVDLERSLKQSAGLAEETLRKQALMRSSVDESLRRGDGADAAPRRLRSAKPPVRPAGDTNQP
jgi:DNA repair exonuclease SbcCD ATPase subunit